MLSQLASVTVLDVPACVAVVSSCTGVDLVCEFYPEAIEHTYTYNGCHPSCAGV